MAPNRRAPRSFARALLHAQPDARLVELAREGRETAFEEIVRRYRTPLVAFAAAYAPAGRAEDVVQESFERSWKALRDSDREIHLKPWLYTIVRNGALNARRGVHYDKPLDESIDGVRRPEDIVLERVELAGVVAAVGALPEAQREALVRSALDGRTHEQIADALGTSPASVRGLIHRARTAVRNGAGAMLPLPLVRALTESGTAEAGAGAAVAATAGATGGGLLAKGATVATIGALAIGGGVAIDRANRDGGSTDSKQARVASESGVDRGGSVGSTPAPVSSSGPGGGPSAGSGSASGDDSSGRGSGNSGDDDDRDDDDSSGPGSGDDDSSGPSSNSGPGSDDSGSGGEIETEVESDLDDNSGSGSSGSGSSGSGSDSSGSGSDSSGSGSSGSGSGSTSSGSGSSGSGSDSSGSGSDSSGSGSGSSGSSGSGSSGSGEEIEVEEPEIEVAEADELDEDNSGSG